jgi:hypothetical protein
VSERRPVHPRAVGSGRRAVLKTSTKSSTFFGTQPYGYLRRSPSRSDSTHFEHRHLALPPLRPTTPSTLTRPAPEDLRVQAVARVGLHSRSASPLLRSTEQRRGSAGLLHQWIAEEQHRTRHTSWARGTTRKARARHPCQTTGSRARSSTTGRRRTATNSATTAGALRDRCTRSSAPECGTNPEWLGKPMTLEVDHINGDWSDDRPENLRLLCPNCHAITRHLVPRRSTANARIKVAGVLLTDSVPRPVK